MIELIKTNRLYYSGRTIYPFYSVEICESINGDGTINCNGIYRYMTNQTALNNWCETEEEAVQKMINYWLSFKGKDMSELADVYQNFVRDMNAYISVHRPEYLI